nr:insulin receptor substrate 1-like [Bactrocera oleae]XP_036231773.1 insulin receptor substrate 1-like [Bactrocera oleae]
MTKTLSESERFQLDLGRKFLNVTYSVLFPRSCFNQSCISNNSLNFGADDTGYKLGLNTNCDKKSTSAPILVQNSQVSVDCMSDLMEIDFSKSTIHKTNGKAVPVSGKCFDVSLNEVKGYQTSKPVSEMLQTFSLKKINHEESGYLEMKPLNQEICPMHKISLSHSNESFSDTTKASDITSTSCVKRKEVQIYSHGNYLFEEKLTNSKQNQLCMPTKELDFVLHEENRNHHLEEVKLDSTSNSEEITNLSCIPIFPTFSSTNFKNN